MKTPKGPEPGWKGVQKEAGPTVLRLQQWATCLGTWPYLPHLAGVAGAANIADQWKEEGGSRQALKGPRCILLMTSKSMWLTQLHMVWISVESDSLAVPP